MTMLMPGMPVAYGLPPGAFAMHANPYYGQHPMQPVAMPMSQHQLAQALGQGTIGAQVVQDRPSVIGSVLAGAGIGAAAGAAFGAIPFLPLGLVSGALVGAGIGATLGLIRSLTAKPRSQEPHILTPQQQAAVAQAQLIAATPPGARHTIFAP
jgi:uncharacterized membrane protein YedE/YeeE